MDEQSIELVLGIIAVIATMVAAYFQSTRKQWGKQGDIILKQAKSLLMVAEAMIPIVPAIAAPVNSLKTIIDQIDTGWNNAQFTTAQMEVLHVEAQKLFEQITAIMANRNPQ